MGAAGNVGIALGIHRDSRAFVLAVISDDGGVNLALVTPSDLDLGKR